MKRGVIRLTPNYRTGLKADVLAGQPERGVGIPRFGCPTERAPAVKRNRYPNAGSSLINAARLHNPRGELNQMRGHSPGNWEPGQKFDPVPLPIRIVFKEDVMPFGRDGHIDDRKIKGLGRHE